MWGLQASPLRWGVYLGSTRRGRVKFFPIGVNSANNQIAGVASCIHKGTNLNSGTSKFSIRKKANFFIKFWTSDLQITKPAHYELNLKLEAPQQGKNWFNPTFWKWRVPWTFKNPNTGQFMTKRRHFYLYLYLRTQSWPMSTTYAACSPLLLTTSPVGRFNFDPWLSITEYKLPSPILNTCKKTFFFFNKSIKINKRQLMQNHACLIL
jgi:hypothetical protein